MRIVLVLAGLLLTGACVPSNITNNLKADEEGITLRQTGAWLTRADDVAQEHCEDYGKNAVRIVAVGYEVRYRCAGASEQGS